MITAQKATMTRSRVCVASGFSGGGTRMTLGFAGEISSVCGDSLSPFVSVMIGTCFAHWTEPARGFRSGGFGEAKGGEGPKQPRVNIEDQSRIFMSNYNYRYTILVLTDSRLLLLVPFS